MTEEKQPEPVRVDARCALCVYSIQQRMSPQDIRSVLVCKRFPPIPVLQPMQGGMGIAAISPPVDPKAFCYEFKHSPEKLIASQEVPNG